MLLEFRDMLHSVLSPGQTVTSTIALSVLIVIIFVAFMTILNFAVHLIQCFTLAWSLTKHISWLGHYKENVLKYTWKFLLVSGFKKEMMKKYPEWSPFF